MSKHFLVKHSHGTTVAIEDTEILAERRAAEHSRHLLGSVYIEVWEGNKSLVFKRFKAGLPIDLDA